MIRMCCVFLLLTGGTARAASFDCAKAKTPQEKAICASPALSAADDKMAAAYRTLLAAVPAGLKDQVREGQRQWLRSVAITCAARPSALPGLMEECLTDEYGRRTSVLHQSIAFKGSVLFVWRSVTLTAPDDAETAENDRQRGVLNDHGTLTASWPQAYSEAPEWQAWNRAMEDASRNIASGKNPESGEEWKQEWAVDQDIDITVTLGLVTPKLATAALRTQWYYHGAAHPNINFTRFNWLLNEKRKLRPEDVFQPVSNGENFIERRCMKELKEQFGAGFPNGFWAPGYLEKILNEMAANPADWDLSADSLTIAFDAGAVSCRACPADPVSIPWGELKPFLKTGFAIPRE